MRAEIEPVQVRAVGRKVLLQLFVECMHRLGRIQPECDTALVRDYEDDAARVVEMLNRLRNTGKDFEVSGRTDVLAFRRLAVDYAVTI